ncbi:MAG: hypothetical protein GY868_01410 [Deltaproteobacteria bacterium]|nr:hypothetical protein [Deltaproteobacteria bacterium]
MALITKAQAKKLDEQFDKMLDVIDILKGQKVIDADEHRAILLKGFSKLVDLLQEKKVINAKQAKDAMKGGFTSLLDSLA